MMMEELAERQFTDESDADEIVRADVRALYQAVWRERAGGADTGEVERALETVAEGLRTLGEDGGGLRREAVEVAELYLEVYRKLAGEGMREELGWEESEGLADGKTFPGGFVREVVYELTKTEEVVGGGRGAWRWQDGLLNGALRIPEREVTLPVLLIDKGNGAGVLADLRLELVESGGRGDGEGSIYPVPALGMFELDEDFRGAMGEVKRWMQSEDVGWWPAGFDVRWRLVRRDGQPWDYPFRFAGDSAGGAFALGCMRLFGGRGEGSGADEELGNLDLERVIVMASFRGGKLRTVGGSYEKFQAARAQSTLRPLALVIHPGQKDEWGGLKGECAGEGIPLVESEELLGLPKKLVREIEGGDNWKVERYLEHLSKGGQTGEIQPEKLADGIFEPMPIERCYVARTTMVDPVRNTAHTKEKLGLKEEGGDGEEGGELPKVDLTRMFVEIGKLEGKRGVYLEGDAALGKTTGAKRIVWEAAKRLLEGGDASELGLPGGMVPVWLRFRELPEGWREGYRRLAGNPDRRLSLMRWLENAATISNRTVDAGEALGRRDLLWVLDGFDEVAQLGDRRELNLWIRELLAERERDKVLLTSRSCAGEEIPGGLVTFRLNPLDEDEQEGLARAYFDSQEVGGSDAAANGFLAAVRLRKKIGTLDQDILGNPLLLTLMCFLYQKKGQIPDSEVEIYRLFVRELVGRVVAGPGGGRASAEGVHLILEGLAWLIQTEDLDQRTSLREGRLEQGAEAIYKELERHNERWTNGIPDEGEEIVRMVREKCGLLVPQGPSGHLGFLHLTFQEYLAARFALRGFEGKEGIKSASGEVLGELLLASLGSEGEAKNVNWRKVADFAVRISEEDLRADDGGHVDEGVVTRFRRAFFRALLQGELDQKDDRLLTRLMDPLVGRLVG